MIDTRGTVHVGPWVTAVVRLTCATVTKACLGIRWLGLGLALSVPACLADALTFEFPVTVRSFHDPGYFVADGPDGQLEFGFHYQSFTHAQLVDIEDQLPLRGMVTISEHGQQLALAAYRGLVLNDRLLADWFETCMELADTTASMVHCAGNRYQALMWQRDALAGALMDRRDTLSESLLLQFVTLRDSQEALLVRTQAMLDAIAKARSMGSWFAVERLLQQATVVEAQITQLGHLYEVL